MVKQVAARLNHSVATVYVLIGTGKLGHHRCPGVRVSEEQLAAYLEETRRGGAAAVRRRPRPKLRHITLG